ncbi:MAG: hypothetical protein RR228_01865 [Bacilli bacterium]
MIIEVLYNDICNLYGDSANVRYLEKCLPDAKFVYTEINDTPLFVSKKVNMIYMGPTTEAYQEVIIEKLLPYKKKLIDLIDSGVTFLIMNNAFDIFTSKIIDNEKVIECLGIFDFYVKRDMFSRQNTKFCGRMKNVTIVGFKSQFTQVYGDNSNNYLFDVIKGFGINKDSLKEGFHYKNFISSYVLGPILLCNPLFTKKIIKSLGVKKVSLAYEDACNEAYNARIKEL